MMQNIMMQMITAVIINMTQRLIPKYYSDINIILTQILHNRYWFRHIAL
jgi:hypothetical protein